MEARYYFNKTTQTSTAQLHHCYNKDYINSSLDKGYFSSQLKSAVVHPLIKFLSKGTTTNNYRLVSNHHSYPKLLNNAPFNSSVTTVTHKTCFWNSNLLTEKNFSCETSLIQLKNDTLCGMENKNITAAIILDLWAAFNTVDQNLLLEILDKKFGIKDKQWNSVSHKVPIFS